MICELRNLPLIFDRQIANAMAIVIAMSSPTTHCDYRDAETILSDLNSDVYLKSSQNCRANRRIQSFRIPMLIHSSDRTLIEMLANAYFENILCSISPVKKKLRLLLSLGLQVQCVTYESSRR